MELRRLPRTSDQYSSIHTGCNTFTKGVLLPSLLLNLSYCSRMDEHRISTLLKNNTCTLRERDDKPRTFASIPKCTTDGLYGIPIIIPEESSTVPPTTIAAARGSRDENDKLGNAYSAATKLRHQQLGQPCYPVMNRMIQSGRY